MSRSPASENLVNPERRDEFWDEYHRRFGTISFKLMKACWYLWYRFSRWHSVSGGMMALQITYVISAVGIVAVPIIVMVMAAVTPDIVEQLEDRAAEEVSAPGTRLAMIGLWVQFLFATLIGFYKSKSSGYLRLDKGELQRRKAVSELATSLAKANAVDPSQLSDPNTSLVTICRCIAWDAQEFLQIGEHDVSCVLLRHRPDEGDAPQGTLESVARDKPADERNWSHKKRPALASYAYEAIRRRRTITYHDVNARWFKEYFPDSGPREYRSVLCVPISFPGREQPWGVLVINVNWPFIFVMRGNKMDTRLSPYLGMANLFLSEGATGDDDRTDEAVEGATT